MNIRKHLQQQEQQQRIVIRMRGNAIDEARRDKSKPKDIALAFSQVPAHSRMPGISICRGSTLTRHGKFAGEMCVEEKRGIWVKTSDLRECYVKGNPRAGSGMAIYAWSNHSKLPALES